MTTTTNKSLDEPASGTLNWNNNLNSNFTIIDNALGSFSSITTTTGNHNLTTAELQNMCWKSSTSAFTANVTYTIPSGVKGQWVVINQSASSAFTLSIVRGSSIIVVDQGKTRSIYCDGTNLFYADSPATAGSDTQIIYNSGGDFAGSPRLTFNGTSRVSIGGSVATTGASCSGTTATVTFSNGEIIPVGSIVTVTDVTPVGYNGTWETIGTAAANQVKFTVPATLTSQTVAGVLKWGSLSLGSAPIGPPASQALAEAGTNNLSIMTPLRTAQAITAQVPDVMNATGAAPLFACRAWVNFNGTTGAINASGNVSSVTKVSTGTFTINFTTAMPNANYVLTGNAIDSNGSNDTTVGVTSLTTTTASITVAHGTSKYSSATVFVQVVC